MGEATVRTPELWITQAALLVVVLVLVPIPAEAVELTGGVGVGAFEAGTIPRLAIPPHAGISWRRESGLQRA